MKQTIWINVDPVKVDLSYLEKQFSGKYDFVAKAIPGNRPDLVREQALSSDVVISTLEKWDEALLAEAEGKVKFIQKYGMGLDNIDLEAAARHHIPVANIIGANSASVAEVALLHILNAGRKFTPCVGGVKARVWPSTITGTELDGKTVGLLGFGNIARNLARMLSGFRVQILTYDPYVKEEQLPEGVRSVGSREELFEQSDIVSLHIPSTPETAGSINRECFDRMKMGAYLINTCRGSVINEADLAEALKSGRIGAAGLDVLCDEPPMDDNPLLDMENVFITSHMGAETAEGGLRSQTIMAETIKAFLEKGELSQYVRNRELLERR